MSAFGPCAAAAYDLVRSHVSRKCDRLTEKGREGHFAASEQPERDPFGRVAGGVHPN